MISIKDSERDHIVMKRYFLSCIVLSILLFGCGKEINTTFSVAESKCESDDFSSSSEGIMDFSNMDVYKLSEAFIDLFLVEEKFEYLFINFPTSDSFTEEVKAEHYSNFSTQVKNKYGDLIKIDNMVYTVDERYKNLEGIIASCSGKIEQFRILLSYDDKKLVGLDIDPPVDMTSVEKGVKFDTGTQDKPLPGILLCPNNGTSDLAIIIPGSGPQDLNGSNGFIKPYRDISEELYNKGIAVYRFNKRTYYYRNELDIEEVTPYEEIIQDVLLTIQKFILSDEHKFSNIYLIGHSQGGYLLPKIYELAKELTIGDHISGLIYLAANASRIEDITLTQYQQYAEKKGLMETPLWQQIILETTNARNKIKGLTSDSEYTAEQLLGMGKKYYLYLADYNPVGSAEAIEIPMLFLFAENDMNVNVFEKNIWYERLGNKSNVDFKQYNGLNHCFMEGSGWLEEDVMIKNHVAEDVIKDIYRWISD